MPGRCERCAHSMNLRTAKLAALEDAQLRRTLVDTARATASGSSATAAGCFRSPATTISISRHHPAVIAAAIEALQRYGVGAGASRLVTGNHPLYAELEARLARLKETEAACVFGSGYLANTGIIPALVGSDDLILIDELSHACIHAGAKLSGATVLPLSPRRCGACRGAAGGASRAAIRAR